MEFEGVVLCGRCHGCKGSLEERIVRHCAPTLAGIKCGSMFRMCDASGDVLSGIRAVNRLLQSSGVSVMILRSWTDAVLVYVYRPEMLSDVISDMRVREFLGDFGYSGNNYVAYLQHLGSRYSGDAMPHEVGVFLGYPLDDVIGFISDRSECTCSGCWKCYSDPVKAECTFRRCRECTCKCIEMYNSGATLDVMAAKLPTLA
ncbi:MAG: DUF3793 family protein [Candidatus Methanomethylophilaceae archaeon]|nr:DUF3793 family protein [Candidatus Methanomethylophilaceae archaeon]MBR6871817.1 DUF3793 family protein [Candidatus Methanomethylophilaceae archaeon]